MPKRLIKVKDLIKRLENVNPEARVEYLMHEVVYPVTDIEILGNDVFLKR